MVNNFLLPENLGECKPHIFAIADNAYTGMGL